MSTSDYRISIIGAGKVGQAMGILLQRAGYEITAVCCRTKEHTNAAARRLGTRGMLDPVQAALSGNLILITTPDDEVAAAAERIARGGGFSPGDLVFHVSGALSVGTLKPAGDAGADTACLHPMQSFAGVEGATEHIPGSVFGVTGRGRARQAAQELVEALGGEAMDIEDPQKVLYHAAACIVSNYLVTLADYAEELYRTIDVDPAMARKAYVPLVEGTAKNLLEKGPDQALTGPIVRGDLRTVHAHLEALVNAGIDTGLYRTLGTRTVALAQRRGAIDHLTADKLMALLLADDATCLSDSFTEELFSE